MIEYINKERFLTKYKKLMLEKIELIESLVKEQNKVTAANIIKVNKELVQPEKIISLLMEEAAFVDIVPFYVSYTDTKDEEKL